MEGRTFRPNGLQLRFHRTFFMAWLTKFVVFFAVAPAVQSQPGVLIGSFGSQTLHGVAGEIYAINQTALYVKGFLYDGAAPDAHFFAGTSDTPGEGFVIPDENGLTSPLLSYSNEDLLIRLSAGTTLENVTSISVYCISFRALFGSVMIPANFDYPAPRSLGEFGFSPRVHNTHADDVIILNTRQFRFVNLVYDGRGPAAYFWTGLGTPDRNDRQILHPLGSSGILPRYNGDDVVVTFPPDLSITDTSSVHFIGIWCVAARQNFGHLLITAEDVANIPTYIEPTTEGCMVLLDEEFHISWAVMGDKIRLTFRGVVNSGEYLAFGVSGSDSITQMVGSDVTVVWMESGTNQPRAVDYSLNAYSQCEPNTGRGACPDVVQGGSEDVTLVRAKVRDGVTVFVIERPLSSGDQTDRTIPITGDVPISWGIGGINPTGHVAKHHTRATGTVTVNFGSTDNSCPELVGPTGTPAPIDPWVIQPLYPANNSVMTAHIGPAGRRRGYQGIVGQIGWGFTWYINETIIPEIYVERGNTYTFQVYGGDDESFRGTYHPFYISNSRDGGYDQKTPDERVNETIYASPVEGAFCEFVGDDDPEQYATFEEYRATLTLNCPTTANPQPGVLRWTVAEDTPDTVYYQCYQHRFFGWEIHVTDPQTTPEPTSTASTDAPTSSSTDPQTTPEPTSTASTGAPTSSSTASTTIQPSTSNTTVATGGTSANATGSSSSRPTESTDASTPRNATGSTSSTVVPTVDAWVIEPLYPERDGVMTVNLGPDGGRKGYQGIIGEDGRGDLVWYINGTIIPEIHVERGGTYKFLVYGGDDVMSSPFHPFYITDSPDGGFISKVSAKRKAEKLYTDPVEGALCKYIGKETPDRFATFEDYKGTLQLDCPQNATAGVLEWTVTKETPDTVYYQSYQQPYLGWKIHVTSGCSGIIISSWIALITLVVGSALPYLQ